MTFGARASASSRRLIRHFSGGTQLTVRKGTGALSTSTRGVAAGTASFTVSCSRPSPFGQRLVDGERIRAGDLRVLVRSADAAIAFPIEPDQLAEISGVTYRVQAVNPHVASLEIQLRGPA